MALSGAKSDPGGPEQRRSRSRRARAARPERSVSARKRRPRGRRHCSCFGQPPTIGEPASFGLLMACLGRGSGLFGSPDGDVTLAGQVMPNCLWPGRSVMAKSARWVATHLHGYTACWGLLGTTPSSGRLKLSLASARQSPQPLLPAATEAADRINCSTAPTTDSLDIGCARGRCILALADLNPDWNHLGVEFVAPRPQQIATPRPLSTAMCACCSAMPTSACPMASGPPSGRLQRVSISFRIRGSNAAIASDGWFSPVDSALRALPTDGELFLQSDVLNVIEPMVALTELCGGFSPRHRCQTLAS